MLINEKRRVKYKKMLFELLQELEDYEDETYPDYSDDDVGKLRLKIQNFLVSLGSEARSSNLETLRQSER